MRIEHKKGDKIKAQSPPPHSPLETKKQRGDTMAQMSSTNAMWLEQLIFISLFKLNSTTKYKMVPGTFAGTEGDRLTKLSTGEKKFLSCLMHSMMMKQLRSSSDSIDRP